MIHQQLWKKSKASSFWVFTSQRTSPGLSSPSASPRKHSSIWTSRGGWTEQISSSHPYHLLQKIESVLTSYLTLWDWYLLSKILLPQGHQLSHGHSCHLEKKYWTIHLCYHHQRQSEYSAHCCFPTLTWISQHPWLYNNYCTPELYIRHLKNKQTCCYHLIFLVHFFSQSIVYR